MKWIVFITVAVLGFFAIPALLPAPEVRKQVEKYFTDAQIERGSTYAFERRTLSWASIILHVGVLLLLTANARRIADACSLLVRGRWLPTLLLMLLICGLATEAVTLPLGMLGLELTRAWELTQRSQADWLSQHFMSIAVYGGGEALVTVVFYVLMRYLPRIWWLVAAVGASVLAVLMAYLHPIVLAPMFNTFTPLSETRWKDQEPRVRELLKKANVDIGDILVMDGSRQGGHTNAYFTGFGSSRQIVLFDTLLEKNTPAEVESVLAHELGHWLHHHIVQGIALGAVGSLAGLFLLFVFLSWVRGRSPWFLRSADDPAGLPLIMMCMLLASWLTMPLVNVVSRHFERQADAMSLELAGQPDVFIEAEKKLALHNISNLVPHPVQSFLFLTHPPAIERIQMAEEWKARHPGAK